MAWERYRNSDDPDRNKLELVSFTGEIFIPKSIFYEPGTEVDLGDGRLVKYGSLPESAQWAIRKRQIIEWLNLFLDETERIHINDLPQNQITLEKHIIEILAEEGWSDQQIATFLSQKFGFITKDAVKKRRQRLKNG